MRRGDRHQQANAGIAHPERREPAQLLGKVEAERGATDDRVDALGPLQVLGSEDARGVSGESLAKPVQVRHLDLQPGGRAVSAEALEVL